MERAFVGAELLEAGLTRSQLRWRYRAVHPRIYVPRGAPSSVELSAHAAWLWTDRRGIVGGRAAAALLGAEWVNPETPIDMIAPRERPQRGVIIRNERIDWDEICAVGEVAVTTPARTALDLARHLERDLAVRHLDALAAATGLTADDVEPLVERYRGSRGMKRARIALDLMDGGAKSKAGPSVNLQAAFRVSAALACMRAISQGCAQVPFKLMRDYEEAGLARKRAARDHVLYDLVTAKPNSWQSAFEFRETQALHACMGNSYAYKGKYRGKVAELILLDPARVKPVQHADWSITYKVTGRDGVTEELAQDQIWHVRGPSWDGFMGLDTLSMAREAMGLSIALEQSQANLHANGVRPTGVYSVDGSLDERQYDKLNAWIKKEAAAGGGGTLILDRGAKWLSQTMTGVDAQHKEIRDQQVEEVCRVFGILPTVIGAKSSLR